MSLIVYDPSIPGMTQQRPKTQKEHCEAAVPWYCGTWGFPAATDIVTGGKCREAWDLYDGCMAGEFKPLPAPPGPTVPTLNPDGTVKVKPGETAQDVLNRQIAESKARQDQYYLDFFRSLPGTTTKREVSPLALIVLGVGGLLLVRELTR